MLERRMLSELRMGLERQAAVALLGPRQAGKTTLALAMAAERRAIYLDLERPGDLAKLGDPEAFLAPYEGRLVILDEIQRVPGLFPVLRGLIDAGRRRGHGTGRFLVLGSASMELLRQSGESLAGRIRYLELSPLDVLEVGADGWETLWLRGGFPESFLAADEAASMEWRNDLIRTYLERDIPQLGPRIPAETLRRFWTMLAHAQGGIHNASRIGASLELSAQTIGRYTDLMVDLLLVRRLQPYLVNVGKRLVKSPKIYLRDSGLQNALLNLPDRDALLGHPAVGGSWEGFVIENLLRAAPAATVAGFYRSSGGAEVDLVLELPGGERWAVEIKRSATARPGRGFHSACDDLQPARRWLVHSGADRFPLGGGVEAIGLCELAATLAAR
jgi:predicted AAA+ superfamily ATPase